MGREWTADDVLGMVKGYQASCVLVAAAELDLFSILASGPAESRRIAQILDADLRGTTTLLDALVALRLLDKHGGNYTLAPKAEELLLPNRPGSVLAMVRHHANCMRRWARLARVVRNGQPVEREPSIRGEAADEESFIEAMHDVSSTTAPGLVEELEAVEFDHLLDIGGGPGTWTIAFLRARPAATATLFDLPHVIPIAQRHIEAEGLADRVRLVAGDFAADPLPAGADLAWLGAIVHQNSRQQNRRLFGSVFAALKRGGRLLIRDVLMDESRTSPPAGALFAVNMLVATEGGGTFTFAELQEDLEAVGFADVVALRRDEAMNSIIQATRPADTE
ncbi:MAG: methyltransferase domain-containing protein [Phycisphaerales bacterium]|nr:MAG: methyltransferase domain-containing protein [Phycisphaerales bacterium]